MENSYIVSVLMCAREENATLTLERMGECKINLRLDDKREFNSRGDDFYEALLQLRFQLEQEGMMINCNGARYDVTCSAMSRQMGLGRKAYKVTMGKSATREDLVDIFAPAPNNLIGTIQQQNDYISEWWKSLGLI